MDIYQLLIASSGHAARKAKLRSILRQASGGPRENGVSSDKWQADRCLGRLRAGGTGLAMIISVLALLYYIRDVPRRAASPCHSLRAYWR